jgi:hypothetical protein
MKKAPMVGALADEAKQRVWQAPQGRWGPLQGRIRGAHGHFLAGYGVEIIS